MSVAVITVALDHADRQDFSLNRGENTDGGSDFEVDVDVATLARWHNVMRAYIAVQQEIRNKVRAL